MIYPQPFISLVQKLTVSTDPNLKFVGLGNPCAKILILEKECAIKRNTTRGEGCYQMVYGHNLTQWQENILHGTTPNDVPNWIASPIGEEYYNRLYPYMGLKICPNLSER